MSERRQRNWSVPLRVRFRSPTEQAAWEQTHPTPAIPAIPSTPPTGIDPMLASPGVTPSTESELLQQTYQIKELIRVGNILRAELGLEEVLQQIVASINACTGFRIASINLIHDNDDYLTTAAFIGASEEGKRIMQERRITVEQMLRTMRPEFGISQSYFVSHEHFDEFVDLPKAVDMPMDEYQPGGWHPEDTLIVPLYSPRSQGSGPVGAGLAPALAAPNLQNVGAGVVPSGLAPALATSTPTVLAHPRLLGFLSLDYPEDGKIPTLESVEMIELFANQAAIAIDNARIFQEREAERIALEEAIALLKGDMEQVQHGDLRVRVQSSHQKLQPIVKAINTMIEEISSILSSMQMVTQAVDEHAHEVQRSSQVLVHDTTQQERQVQSISEVIDGMANTLYQVSERAIKVSQVTEEAREVTVEGQNKVDRATDGMRQVRETTMQSSRIMKRLGESSQEINDTVVVITDLTTRMNLLALNAAIEAVRAGEHGQGFVVIAQEIRTLAVHSAEAARKVANRIRTIQHETGTVSQSIEHNIQRVVMQTELVTESGMALESISIVTQQMANLVQDICMAAESQAQGSQLVVRSIEEIFRMTSEITQQMRNMQQSMTHLVELTDSLRSRMSVFRIAEK